MRESYNNQCKTKGGWCMNSIHICKERIRQLEKEKE